MRNLLFACIVYFSASSGVASPQMPEPSPEAALQACRLLASGHNSSAQHAYPCEDGLKDQLHNQQLTWNQLEHCAQRFMQGFVSATKQKLASTPTESLKYCRLLADYDLLGAKFLEFKSMTTCMEGMLLKTHTSSIEQTFSECLLLAPQTLQLRTIELFTLLVGTPHRDLLGEACGQACSWCSQSSCGKERYAPEQAAFAYSGNRLTYIHYRDLAKHRRKDLSALGLGAWSIQDTSGQEHPVAVWRAKAKSLGIVDFDNEDFRGNTRTVRARPLYWQLRHFLFDRGYRQIYFFYDKDLSKRRWTRLELDLLLSGRYTGDIFLVFGTPELDDTGTKAR